MNVSIRRPVWVGNAARPQLTGRCSRGGVSAKGWRARRARGDGRGLDPGLLLDRAFAQSAVRISLYDNDVRYVRMNQADLRALGLTGESAVIGLRPAELSPDPGFGPAHAASFEAAARRAIATGEHVTWQTSGEAGSSGQERAWLVSITPVRDGGGVVCGALAVTFEVTERDLARQRLALVNEASKRIGSTRPAGPHSRGTGGGGRPGASGRGNDRHPGIGTSRR